MKLGRRQHCVLNQEITDASYPLLLPPCYSSWALYHLVPQRPCPSHFPTSQPFPLPTSLTSQPSPSGLPSQPCTPELHTGSAVLQEESLGPETQVGRVVERNSPDLELPQEDKDKDAVEKEVGQRGWNLGSSGPPQLIDSLHFWVPYLDVLHLSH